MMKLLITLVLFLITKCSVADNTEKNKTELDVPKPSINYQLLEVKLAALEAKIARQGAYNAALSARVAAQDARATSCEKQRSEQEERDRKILRDVKTLRTSITERSSNVSFLAVSSSSQTVPAYAAVKFDTVVHNAAPPGYGYDKIIHRFRCPVDGVYAFFFSATTTDSTDRWHRYGIMKESTLLSTARTSTRTDNRHEALSASAVTPCSRGDYVYIKNVESTSRPRHGNSAIHFTGFKIY